MKYNILIGGLLLGSLSEQDYTQCIKQSEISLICKDCGTAWLNIEAVIKSTDIPELIDVLSQHRLFGVSEVTLQNDSMRCKHRNLKSNNQIKCAICNNKTLEPYKVYLNAVKEEEAQFYATLPGHSAEKSLICNECISFETI